MLTLRPELERTLKNWAHLDADRFSSLRSEIRALG